MSVEKVNNLIRAEIFVTDSSGNPVTGLVNSHFQKLLSKDGANNTTVITVVEIDTGRYTVTFTPTLIGFYELTIIDPTYNKFGWTEDFEVTVDGELTAIEVRQEMDANSTQLASISSRLPAALINGEMASFILDITNNVIKNATFQPGAISNSVIAADVNTYQAKVWLFDDNIGLNDRYTVAWFKNSQPILSGITSPTIEVIKASDGSDLISPSPLTQVSTTGLYFHNEVTSRIIAGSAYFALVTATIDGQTRTWVQPIGRDS